MENERARLNGFCRDCGCNHAQAAADAKALGFEREFDAGIYTCCQLAQWADEQWLVWHEAAVEDGKVPEEVTRALEVEAVDTRFVPVHIRLRQDPRFQGGLPSQFT